MKPQSAPAPLTPIGILLSAGKGSRFDASGASNKLLAPLQSGSEIGLPVGFVAARRMRNALSHVIAVVDAKSPHCAALSTWFEKAGCEVLAIHHADDGMGASLAAAVSLTLAPEQTTQRPPATMGWVVGLADMPMIAPATLQAITQALVDEQSIVAPVFEGTRGHPVAFGAAHGPALAALTGDTGARAVIDAHGFIALHTGDAGVCRDIDQPADLQAC